MTSPLRDHLPTLGHLLDLLNRQAHPQQSSQMLLHIRLKPLARNGHVRNELGFHEVQDRVVRVEHAVHHVLC